jgi:small redox-active disulfide protein 2
VRIEILGMGCPKCKKLAAAAEEAVRMTGVEAEVVKVEQVQEIVNYGVSLTPALAINGQLCSQGRVLTAAQIAELIRGAVGVEGPQAGQGCPGVEL